VLVFAPRHPSSPACHSQRKSKGLSKAALREAFAWGASFQAKPDASPLVRIVCAAEHILFKAGFNREGARELFGLLSGMNANAARMLGGACTYDIIGKNRWRPRFWNLILSSSPRSCRTLKRQSLSASKTSCPRRTAETNFGRSLTALILSETSKNASLPPAIASRQDGARVRPPDV
jgi:hypothetical protein